MDYLPANLTAEKLALYFDHTLLRADASEEDFRQLCKDSMEYGFKMVAINPAPVSLCKELLKDSQVLVGAAIGFPLGQSTLETKVFETQNAIANGSDEIDYVINVSMLKEKNYSYIEKEMASIVDICRINNITSKVIFENCYLTDDEKRELCKIALNVKPNFIKTSTGFGTGGATYEDIELMKSIVQDSVKVKASGGIRNLDTALGMIKRGAERIGSTSSIKIVEEFLEINNK